MRGGHVVSRTMQRPPANDAIARPYSHPAPYDGWNARGNLANMKPTEALLMDNIFPGVQNVTQRNGYISWATGVPSNIHSLMPYSGLTTSKLFAATDSAIYDVTASGAVGAAVVSSLASGYWSTTMISTAGGNFMFCVNGTNSAITFDGAVWATPAITGGTSSTWSQVVLHKHRLWAVQKNTMNLWYLGVDSIAGAATQFPIGAIFSKGGYIVSIGTWTLDSGTGPDDYFVVVTSNGQIAVYAGTDPSTASTWAIIGVFNVPKPVGNRPLMKYGGDLLYLSMIGIIPLSTMVQSVIIDHTKAISFSIDGAFLDAASSYAANQGWQMSLYTATNALIVNVPVVTDTSSVQFVMNTSTKAWCRFTGWNASCFAELNGNLYFANGGGTFQAWTGTKDGGNPIVGTVAQAYARYGNQLQSQVSLVRPNFGFTGAAQINMSIDSDFKTFNGQTVFTYTPSGTGAVWGTSLWDTGIWDTGVSNWDPKWTTVPGDLGYLHSFRLQISASSGNFIWTSTDFALQSAGIL